MANLENNNQNNDSQSYSNNKNKIGLSKSDINKTVSDATEEIKEGVKTFAEESQNALLNPLDTAENIADQAVKDVVSFRWWVKLMLIVFWTLFSLVAIVLVLINLPSTKRWAANQALDMLNKDFKAEMYTNDVQVNYFGDVTISGLRIKDNHGLEFIKIRELKVNSDWISLIKNSLSAGNNSLSFNSISMKNADIKVITYEGDSISNFIRYIDNFDSGKERDPNTTPFQLDSRLYIIDSKLSIVNRNLKGDEGKWLMAENLNLKIPKVKVNGGDVFAQINNLSFTTTRWGKRYGVDTFSTEMALTDDFLSLKNLTFNTDKSLLQGDLKFNLNEGSWSDFSNKVAWDLNLMRGSQISGYEIGYFVTDWDNYLPINISGKMQGPLNNFYLKNFVLGNKEVSINTTSIRFKSLLENKFLIETNTISTDFTYKELKNMLPSFISSKMGNFADDFGRLKYKGEIALTQDYINIKKGNLLTGIGSASISNLNLENYSGKNPKYKGFVDVKDLNTYAFTKSKQVGLISGRFNLDGQGFDLKTMKLKTTSTIERIELMGKTLNNVYLEGLLDSQKYLGKISINDDQAKAKIDGLIDFSTSRIKANIGGVIDYLNVNYFTGGKGKQLVSGVLKGNLSMSTLNDLILDAQFSNLKFTNNTDTYIIPEADIKTFIENSNRVVSVDAPGAVSGRITGKFNLGDLPAMIENGIGKLMVGYVPRKSHYGQQFNLEFDIRQNLVNYFLPELRIKNGAFVNGSYDGQENNLVLNLDASEVLYVMTKKADENQWKPSSVTLINDEYDYDIPAETIRKSVADTNDSVSVNTLALRINTAHLEEQFFLKIERAKFGKQIVRDAEIIANNFNNEILKVNTNFKYGSEEDEIVNELENYSIRLNQTTNSSGDYIVRFEPLEIEFNKVAWSIDTNPDLNHSIIYRKKEGDFIASNIRLFSQDSEFFIKDAQFKSSKYFEANAEVNNFQISKIFDMLEGGNSMNIKGLADGDFHVKMENGFLQPLIDLKIDDIKMGEDDMGDFILLAKQSSIPNIFDITARIESNKLLGNNNLDLEGTINNNTSSPTLDMEANMNDFDLRFTNQFVKGIFSNMRGKAKGVLSIVGPLNDIDYSGDISLNNFGLKLDFTGVDYSFDDTVVNLTRGAAVLNDIGVRDGRSNSAGSISGAIYFQTLSSMAVELIMRADNLLLLNSTQSDNDLFWGRIYGEGNLYVSGLVNGLTIQSPDMRALNNSVFTFNSNSTSNVEDFKMLRFLKQDEKGTVVVAKKEKTGANMNVDFRLNVDKGTTVNVLVGDDIGNISVKGTSGNLRFLMSRNGSINMSGGYIVDTGSFSSKAVLNRTFQIQRGSSIIWDGNPMTPSLDITANYVRTVSNAGDYLGIGSLQPIQVLLQTKISQTLSNPDIELVVSALDVSSQVKETLASRMGQEDERVIQFGSILLMNRFNTSATGFNMGSIAEDTGYNMLFKQLGSVLNTISSEFQIDLNYVKGDEASQTSDRANAGVSLAISPRVSVKTGLGIPLTRGTEATNVDYLSGEGTIEYDASKNNDGSFILRGYSKPMNIGMSSSMGSNSSANQAYGVGVVWSKSFNRIFKTKKNDKNHTKKESSDSVEIQKKDSL